MGALLASIGIKDYVYGALIVAIIAAFAFYTHHEREIGIDEALAPVSVLANKAATTVAVGTAVAKITEKDNAHAYTAATAAPAPASLGIVCHSAARSGDVPQAVAVAAPGAGNGAVDGGSSAAYDPSGAALKLGADTDAQVTYLQARVKELEDQMTASP